MDTNNTAGNQGSNPQPNPPNSSPSTVNLTYDSTPLNNLASAINEQTHAQQIIDANSDATARGQLYAQKNGNTINAVSIFVNTIVAVVAVWALIMSSKSLAVSNNALKTTQQQFELANQGHLEVINSNMFFGKNQTLHFWVETKNLGPTVVEGIARTDTAFVVLAKDSESFIKNPFAGIDTNNLQLHTAEYYSNESGHVAFGFNANILPLLDSFQTHKVLIFYIRINIYKNPVRFNYRKYECVLQMKPLNQTSVTPDPTAYYITFAFNYAVNSNYDLGIPVPNK